MIFKRKNNEKTTFVDESAAIINEATSNIQKVADEIFKDFEKKVDQRVAATKRELDRAIDQTRSAIRQLRR